RADDLHRRRPRRPLDVAPPGSGKGPAQPTPGERTGPRLCPAVSQAQGDHGNAVAAVPLPWLAVLAVLTILITLRRVGAQEPRRVELQERWRSGHERVARREEVE